MLPPLNDLIAQLQLQPHPEGGYYRRTYEAGATIPQAALPAGFAGARAAASAIYYLLERGGTSCLHRLRSDEMWHLYLGGPLTVVELPATPGEPVRETRLGHDLAAGDVLQHTVYANTWFGATMPADAPAAYTLLGCTVHPAFDFAEFEMATRGALLATHGSDETARAWISRLTPSDGTH